jgi:hypothetical protein
VLAAVTFVKMKSELADWVCALRPTLHFDALCELACCEWVVGNSYLTRLRNTLINTCFGTHHLVFAEDANNTLWTSSGGGGGAVGWLNTRMFDETHDEEKSQGWTALILDTNGNGKRDEYVEPDQAIDPTKDKRINAAFYGVTVSPVDGSIWGTVLGFPGAVVRLNPGPNPPATALAEIYELPWNNPNAPVHGFSPRGLDIDRNARVLRPSFGSG